VAAFGNVLSDRSRADHNDGSAAEAVGEAGLGFYIES
jgi:hypothetical protein